jgi:hypothetical protein
VYPRFRVAQLAHQYVAQYKNAYDWFPAIPPNALPLSQSGQYYIKLCH